MARFPSPASRPFQSSWSAMFAAVLEKACDRPDHPVQIALRTYSLCFFFSLGPALLPLVFALVAHPRSLRARARVFWKTLENELRPTGFAPAITTAVAGGVALQRLWDLLGRRYTSKLPPHQRAFLANVATSTLAVALLRRKRHRRLVSPTSDFTILLLVRALDASVQAFLFRRAQEAAARQVHAALDKGVTCMTPVSNTTSFDKRREDLANELRKKAAMRLDALVFWASSARVMWCFFYQPERLPRSYAKWINSLANVDKGLLEVLRAIRGGTWSYIHGSSAKRDIVDHLAEKLGRSRSCADPSLLPAYGGDFANATWVQLGVSGRNSIGGLPCELVHGGIGTSFGLQNSCIANAAIRAAYAFSRALFIYLPVHFLPVLLTKPRSLMSPQRISCVFLSAIRSATFLSMFVSSCWFGVCLTRTLVLARFLPSISHDVWDGPYGCALAGSLMCGISVWIENARRRGEMALYVLPKALRASVSEKWVRSQHRAVRSIECLTFVLSLASLLTFSVHQPESLRGLSRWTLAFVMKGHKAAGLWKRHKKEIVNDHQPSR